MPDALPLPTRAYRAAKHIAVPAASGRAMGAGLALYTPCKPTVVALHHVAWAVARSVGRAAGPFVTTSRDGAAPPWWSALPAAAGVLGGADAVAVHARAQRERTGGGALLIRRGRPIAFVRIGEDPAVAEREQRILAELDGGTPALRTVRPLGWGEADGWAWSATTPLPARPHRPTPGPRAEEVSRLVARAAPLLPPRGPDQGDLVPVHADLTPWNLRRVAGHGDWLLDLDDVTWGPAGADAALWEVATAFVRGRDDVPPLAPDVASFWERRLGERAARGDDVAGAMLARLRARAR